MHEPERDEGPVVVSAFGNQVSQTEIRELGFALVGLATLMERSAKQSAQALDKPSPKECAEARAARNRVRDGVVTVNCLIAGLRK